VLLEGVTTLPWSKRRRRRLPELRLPELPVSLGKGSGFVEKL